MAAEAHWVWTPDGFEPATSLPLTDRGFRYGMAVFETLRVQTGGARFSAEHLESLARACWKSDFPVSAAALEDTSSFLAHHAWPADCGVARIHVTGGDGGPRDPVRACRVFIAFERREPPTATGRAAGYRVRLHPEPFQPVCGGLKTHNYWPNVAALRAARAAGYDEALLFDAQDHLISASLGNVFVSIGNGEWLTPTTATGARRGIIRSVFLQHGDAREGLISRNQMAAASSILITNSWIGAATVAAVENQPLKETVSFPSLTDTHCHWDGIVWP